MKKIFLALIFIVGACAYAQQEFQLQFPVKCSINKDCWVLNYVDNDSTGNWHDYNDGRQTYDGHRGTDIAIKNITKMKQGVNVVAAVNGYVIATRDGVPDRNALAEDLNQLQDIGCGNRVAIKHSGGWITDYCHMKNGSIKVKKGDYVSAGQTIGQIGMSGLSEFPHLHLNFQQGNHFFDPFTGHEQYSKIYKHPLWSSNILKQLSYKPKIIYNIGVSPEIPSLLDVREEKYKSNQINSISPMIMIWVDAMHVEVNDIIYILIKNPDGTTFLSQKIVVDKANAKKLFYIGRKNSANKFQKGDYNVKVSFKRPNYNINDFQSFNFVVY